jgi:steroid delta-isomerase-like uncharacterized protein
MEAPVSSFATTPQSYAAIPDLAARRGTLVDYLETLSARGDFARYLADDVTFTIVGTPAVRGRAEVEATIRTIHEQAFDSVVRIRSTIVEPERAVAELTFVGRHTGEFAGVPATGRRVEVDYAAAYEFGTDGRITAIRAYIPMNVLMAQLGVGG